LEGPITRRREKYARAGWQGGVLGRFTCRPHASSFPDRRHSGIGTRRLPRTNRRRPPSGDRLRAAGYAQATAGVASIGAKRRASSVGSGDSGGLIYRRRRGSSHRIGCADPAAFRGGDPSPCSRPLSPQIDFRFGDSTPGHWAGPDGVAGLLAPPVGTGVVIQTSWPATSRPARRPVLTSFVRTASVLTRSSRP